MKKHLRFGLVLLSLVSVNIHAEWEGSNKNHSSADVFLSSPDHTFEVQGSCLLLQPTSSALHYAAEAIPLPVISPNWKIYEINTDYHPGFDIEVTRIFQCTNTNLRLGWEHFQSTDSASKELPSSDMIGPLFEIGPDASAYKKVSGHVTFHFDEIGLNYGVFVNFGDRLQTNLFTGLSLMRVKQTLNSNFSSLDNTIVRSINVPSTFTGAGPQLGFDFGYRIVEGFHFTGETAVSFLVGTQKNHTTYQAFSPALAQFGVMSPNTQTTSVGKKTQVVPGVEGKLGLSYVFTFCKNYMVKIEAGYQAQVYLDAIQSMDIGSEVVTPPILPDTVGVYARTFEQTISNFALAGPYFTIDIGF